MPTPTHHLDHIREQLLRAIGWTIKERVRDPRVPPIVTITDIKLATDTRNATVFVSIYGDDKVRKGALIALNRAAPYIQTAVAQRVSMRHFPRLIFKLDDSLDRGMHIDELLREIKDDLA
jgi:ribosome-binding factor A